MAKLKKTDRINYSTLARTQSGQESLPCISGMQVGRVPWEQSGRKQASWRLASQNRHHTLRGQARHPHTWAAARLETIQMPINRRPDYTTEKVNQHWPRTALQQVSSTVLSGKKASRRKTNVVWFPSREFNTDKTNKKKCKCNIHSVTADLNVGDTIVKILLSDFLSQSSDKENKGE